MSVSDFIKDIFQKHGTDIMIGAGIAGTGVAMVLSAKGAIRADHEISDKKKELNRELTAKEKIKIFAKHELPAAGVAACSWAGIIKGTDIKNQNYAELGALLATTRTNFSNYRKVMEKKLGPEKEKEAVKEASTKSVVNNYMVDTGQNVLMYESWSKQYCYTTETEVQYLLNYLYYKSTSEGFVPISDLLSELGLKISEVDTENGWNAKDGPFRAIFDETMKTPDGKAAIVINYPFGHEPHEDRGW